MFHHPFFAPMRMRAPGTVQFDMVASFNSIVKWDDSTYDVISAASLIQLKYNMSPTTLKASVFSLFLVHAVFSNCTESVRSPFIYSGLTIIQVFPP